MVSIGTFVLLQFVLVVALHFFSESRFVSKSLVSVRLGLCVFSFKCGGMFYYQQSEEGLQSWWRIRVLKHHMYRLCSPPFSANSLFFVGCR